MGCERASPPENGVPVDAALSGPVADAIDAANAGDTERFLAAFTTNGAVDDWGRVFSGPEQIRRWSDREFIGADVRLDIRSVSSSGAVTTVAAEVGGSGFNGPSNFAFTVEGNRLSLMQITG